MLNGLLLAVNNLPRKCLGYQSPAEVLQAQLSGLQCESAMPRTGDEDGPVLLYEIARWRLDEQLDCVRSLDNKLAATFTLNAAVVALFGAAMALAGRAMPYYVWGLELAVLCVFLINLTFTYRAYRQTDWSVRPHLDDLNSLIGAYPNDAIRAWVVSEIAVSLKHNEAGLTQKGRDSRVALAAAIVDAALIGVAAVAATAPFA